MAREPQNLMCLEGSAGKNDLSRDKSFFFAGRGAAEAGRPGKISFRFSTINSQFPATLGPGDAV